MKKFKNFYLDNMKLIHKFLLFQLAMALFGFTVILSSSAFGNTAAVIATVAATLFFTALLYDAAWEEGERDRNRILNGRLKKRPLHGAKVALFSYIPTMFFVAIDAVLTVVMLCGASLPKFFELVLTVSNAILLFLAFGMYLGFSYVLADFVPRAYTLFFVLYAIPAVLAYGLGYYLGTQDKQIKTLFGMKPSLGKPAGTKRK